MGQKNVHLVDAELAMNAQYKHFANIPSHALSSGSTVRFLPGVYEMGRTNVDFGGVATLEGVGNPGDVVLANFILGSASGNTINFRNLTLSGNSGVAASTGYSFFIDVGTSATVKFNGCTFTNGDFGVDNQSAAAVVYMDYCDASGVDRALRSNLPSATGNCFISFSTLNTSANAYFTGANTLIKSVTTLASYAGAANTGNTLETIRALIS